MSTRSEIADKIDILIGKLIDDTSSGRLRWQETAADDTFIAAWKGRLSFRVDATELIVHDGNGDELHRRSMSDGRLFRSVSRSDHR